MAERKLEYWYDWDIFGPDGDLLVSLRSHRPDIDDKKLSDIEYLCKMIKEHRGAMLRNENVVHRIIMLEQLSLTDRKAARDLKRVGKAISKIKSSKVVQDLKGKICFEIKFFREIHELKKDKNLFVKAAIKEWLTRGTKDNFRARARRLREESNYTTVYYAYKNIYTKLKSAKLTDPEIFCFFEKAGSHIDKPNPAIDVHPEDRLLTFVKSNTWYTKGEYMYLEVDGKAVRIS